MSRFFKFGKMNMFLILLFALIIVAVQSTAQDAGPKTSTLFVTETALPTQNLPNPSSNPSNPPNSPENPPANPPANPTNTITNTVNNTPTATPGKPADNSLPGTTLVTAIGPIVAAGVSVFLIVVIIIAVLFFTRRKKQVVNNINIRDRNDRRV